jgi:hypothetical protein
MCPAQTKNWATDEWSICAVSERQLNCKWSQGQKRKEKRWEKRKEKKKDVKRKRDAKK